MSDTTNSDVRLQGDITEVTRVVLLVKNEFVFLKGRAENGTVTSDDLTGLETALGELKNLHPDVADAVDNTTAGVATIGTDPTAGPTAPTAPETSNPGPGPDVPSNIGTPVPTPDVPSNIGQPEPGPDVPSNIGQPEPGATDDDPIDNSRNSEPVAEDGQIGVEPGTSTNVTGDEA